MKKLSEIKRGITNTYLTTKDNSIQFPMNYDFITYDSKVNLENGTYMNISDYSKSTDEMEDCKTINQLIADGTLKKVQYVDEYEIFPKGFESDSQHPENLPYDEIIAELTENGYNVTRQALEHNYNAWLADCKSGYRDEENGYFIFTPCGCNNLYFNVTKLDDHFDWQYTYIA